MLVSKTSGRGSIPRGPATVYKKSDSNESDFLYSEQMVLLKYRGGRRSDVSLRTSGEKQFNIAFHGSTALSRFGVK